MNLNPITLVIAVLTVVIVVVSMSGCSTTGWSEASPELVYETKEQMKHNLLINH